MILDNFFLIKTLFFVFLFFFNQISNVLNYNERIQIDSSVYTAMTNNVQVM